MPNIQYGSHIWKMTSIFKNIYSYSPSFSFSPFLSFSCSGLLVRLLCQLCFKHLLWEHRSVVWKSPTEAFKGCGSQAKSNICVWSGGEVHRRNLFIPPPQMRISAAVRMHLRVLGNESQQVTWWDTYTNEADYNIPLLGQAALHCCRRKGKYYWILSFSYDIPSVYASVRTWSLYQKTFLSFLLVPERRQTINITPIYCAV